MTWQGTSGNRLPHMKQGWAKWEQGSRWAGESGDGNRGYWGSEGIGNGKSLTHVAHVVVLYYYDNNDDFTCVMRGICRTDLMSQIDVISCTQQLWSCLKFTNSIHIATLTSLLHHHLYVFSHHIRKTWYPPSCLLEASRSLWSPPLH